MEKPYSINKERYFLNPWFDIIFLAGFPTAFIIIFLLVYPYFKLNSLYYNYIYINFYLYTIFNFPHVISGFSIFLDKQELANKKLIFLWIPILFFLITLAISIIGAYFDFKGKLMDFRNLWGSTHIFLQNIFILQLYKLRNRDLAKFDTVLDNLFLLICGYDSLIRSYLAKMRYAGFLDILYLRYFFFFWRFLINIIVIIFVLRQLYLFIRYKKIYPFKILLLSAVFIVYYYTFIITGNVYAAFIGQVELHNVQWIAWAFLFHRIKFKKGIIKDNKILSYLFQPGHIHLYIFILMGSSIIFNLTYYIILGYVFKIHITKLLFLSLYAIALTHFFTEILIWRYSSLRKMMLRFDTT